MSRKSDLPFGSEFSPSQIELSRALELAATHGGDWRAFERAVRTEWFEGHSTSDYNRNKLANNTKLGMIAYGIIDREANLTALGEELHRVRSDDEALHERLAKHILLNLHGMTLVQCLRDMKAAGEGITLSSLREALAVRGIHFPRGGKHPSVMRLWLAKAGVMGSSGWRIDENRLEDILGASSDTFTKLGVLTPEQRAFVRTLANLGESAPQPANEVARLATTTYGVRFPEKSLPRLVLDGLVKAGYITTEKTTSGRGAKPFLVAPTAALTAEIVEPFLDQLRHQVDPKLVALLRKSLSEVLGEIKSRDRHIAGLALEALAFKLMRLLDMSYVSTRLRADQIGGAEVDLVFDSTRLTFSRWQIQCKNTASVSLEDLAKEVGVTPLLRSTSIVIVTTGTVGTAARQYAARIMKESNLAIVILDGHDLNTIVARPTRIVDVLEREAKTAMQLKVFKTS